jgi:hypothetical protein
MDLTQYTTQEIMSFAEKYLIERKKKKGYTDTYRKTDKGKLATRKAALKYYYNTYKKKSKSS